MCCDEVMTSGAGTSSSGPRFLAICLTQPLQSRSCSPRLSDRGSQTIDPFAPPSGRSTMAHFHVINIANARTSSTVVAG